MNQVVVAEMIHASREMREDQEELIFIQTIAVLRIIKKIEETASSAELHHNHLTNIKMFQHSLTEMIINNIDRVRRETNT